MKNYSDLLKKMRRRNRAGVIPYFYNAFRGTYMFLFGCDNTKFGRASTLSFEERLKQCDYTPFMGGVEKNETFEEAALRELKEESLGTFDWPLEALHQAHFVDYDGEDGYQRLYFVYMPLYSEMQLLKDIEKFNSIRDVHSEMIAIRALSLEKFQTMFWNRDPLIYWKTMEILHKNFQDVYRFFVILGKQKN